MTCQNYKGKTKCGLHSVYYVLTDQHVREYCTTDRFQSCSEIEKFAQRQPKSISIHTAEGVLGREMGPSDDEAHYGVYNEENE